MTEAMPPVGLRHSQTIAVTAGLTVPEVSPAFGDFRDMPPVFATAFMVGFVEATCIAALQPFLGEQQQTVGTRVDLSHSAATPVGMSVSAEVELIEVSGRRLRFKVTCRDDAEVIGEGYGIGQAVLRELNGCIKETRLADLKEVAKALGKPTAHAQPRMRLQKWA